MPQFIENIIIGIREWVTGIIDDRSYVIALHLTELHNEKENRTNKVTSISNISTDTQYPSAKCVYDEFEDSVISETISNVLSLDLNIGINSNNIPTKTSDLVNDSGFVKTETLTIDLYDALDTKDGNTVYYVTNNAGTMVIGQYIGDISIPLSYGAVYGQSIYGNTSYQ